MKRFAICLLVLGLGCGDDDKDDGTDEQAPENCEAFIDKLCERMGACQVESGAFAAADLDAAIAHCHEGFANQGIDCADAKYSPADVDQCHEDIDAAGCADLDVQEDGTPLNVPTSCIP
jgi:hypothetical protein